VHPRTRLLHLGTTIAWLVGAGACGIAGGSRSVAGAMPPSTSRQFAFVPGCADFELGTDELETSPAHHDFEARVRVRVDDFWIARHPVTAVEFCAFLNRPQARHEDQAPLYALDDDMPYKWSTIERAGTEWRPRRGAADAPANRVTWLGAVEYCEWLTSVDPHGVRYRLPTEAEWEYAARGAARRAWPWGAEAPTPERGWTWTPKAWDGAEPWMKCPVGSFPLGATPEGVMDLLGTGLEEWCLGVYRAHPDADDLTSTAFDRADLQSPRAARGGREQEKARMTLADSFYSDSWHPARVWSRFSRDPLRDFGSFRVVAEPPGTLRNP
jgi:formylglycine-generating enzyme required for sulfatase activity